MVSLMQLPDFAPQQRRQSLLLDLAPINQGIGFAAQENQRAQSNARADRQMQLAENADKRAASSETRQAKAFDNSQEDRQIANLAAMVRHVADDPNPQTRTANYQRIVSTPQMAERLAKAGVDTSNMDATLGFLTTKINAYMSPQQREAQNLQNQVLRKQANAPLPDQSKVLEAKDGNIVRVAPGQQGEVVYRSDAKAQGPYKDAKQLADVEDSLRKEYAQLAKPYFETRDAWNRVQQSAAKPSAAGDIALIFNFMKMLDPGSVVREGEFATAQNASGVPDRVVSMYNRLLSGERLTENIRADFINQAQGLFSRSEQQYGAIQEQYKGIAQRRGIDPRNTFLDYSSKGGNKPDPLGIR